MRSNLQPVPPEELMAYLDGELSADRAARAAAHLQECRECQILAAELKSVSESLTAWDIEAKEPRIGADIAQALDEREQQVQGSEQSGPSNWLGSWKSRRIAPWLGGAFAGGLVVLLLLTFTLTFSSSRSTRLASPAMQQVETSRLPSATPTAPIAPGDRDSRLEYSATLKAPSSLDSAKNAPTTIASDAAAVHINETPAAPMILRTAQLTVVTQNLDKARSGMDKIVQKYSGYVGDLAMSAPSDGPRKLTATLRLPAAQLDAALAEIKTLGRVESESQNGQDVTAQYVDLQARLGNSRNTEQRLIELLRQRTGKLSDVLEVETELSRVREEIERMEGERRLMAKQVEFATLTATLTEEFKAKTQVVPDSLGTRFRNAAVEGYGSVVDFVIDVALFLLYNGPMLLLWGAVLFFPARFGWRKLRNRQDPPSLQ